tara:strand:+ start:2505 stop:3329 length:825 start_codon:yes stop_codon:yes gene_type:complete
MKFKHNKKRNTAFLYETMIKELTKAVVNKDLEQKDFIVETMKQYFNSNTPLGKELRIYRDLNETSGVDLYTAERLLAESKKDFHSMDRKEIFNLQTELISEINKAVGKEVFNNFVPNYKSLATIYQIFSNQSSTKELILLERRVLKTLISKSTKAPAKKMPHVNNLTLKTFIKNYNEKYSQSISENQQELLNKYILSFSDNGLEFKLYLNEEVARLKNELHSILESGEYSSDNDLKGKLTELQNLLESFSRTRIDDKMIVKVLKVQNLIKETKE